MQLPKTWINDYILQNVIACCYLSMPNLFWYRNFHTTPLIWEILYFGLWSMDYAAIVRQDIIPDYTLRTHFRCAVIIHLVKTGIVQQLIYNDTNSNNWLLGCVSKYYYLNCDYNITDIRVNGIGEIVMIVWIYTMYISLELWVFRISTGIKDHFLCVCGGNGMGWGCVWGGGGVCGYGWGWVMSVCYQHYWKTH